jgi:hypothetical protein
VHGRLGILLSVRHSAGPTASDFNIGAFRSSDLRVTPALLIPLSQGTFKGE